MTNPRPDTQLCKMMWVRLMVVLTATATFCRAEQANKDNLEVRGKADDILRWWLLSTASSFLLHTIIALWNLATMATKVIKCPLPVFPIPYGCWCGINVTPNPQIPDPIDEFDAACRDHDHCYEDGDEDHI